IHPHPSMKPFFDDLIFTRQTVWLFLHKEFYYQWKLIVIDIYYSERFVTSIEVLDEARPEPEALRTKRSLTGGIVPESLREEIISSNYTVDHWRRNDDHWFSQFIKAAEQNIDKKSFESLKEKIKATSMSASSSTGDESAIYSDGQTADESEEINIEN
ncbi:4358_t:CDS:2, partial [Gigaspora margarita]